MSKTKSTAKQVKLTLSPQLYEHLVTQAETAGLTTATYLRLLVASDAKNAGLTNTLIGSDQGLGDQSHQNPPPQIIVVNNDGRLGRTSSGNTGSVLSHRTNSGARRLPRARQTVKLDDVLKMI